MKPRILSRRTFSKAAIAAPWIVRAQQAPLGARIKVWLAPGSGAVLPKEMTFNDPLGRLGVLNAEGPIETMGNPFFEPLGANGRACVTCHQPANAMSLSLDTIRERWRTTSGKDPLFAAIEPFPKAA